MLTDYSLNLLLTFGLVTGSTELLDPEPLLPVSSLLLSPQMFQGCNSIVRTENSKTLKERKTESDHEARYRPHKVK